MQVLTLVRAEVNKSVTQRCHNSPRRSASDVTHRKRAEVCGELKERRVETRQWMKRFDFWGSLRRDEFASRGYRTR